MVTEGPVIKFPTIEEQQNYWKDKERTKDLAECVDAFSVFLGDMQAAMAKLNVELTRLAKKNPKE